MSLSDGRPAIQGTLAYDASAGGYAGVFASSARLAGSSTGEVHALAFAGFAAPLGSGLNWDAGGQLSAFTTGHEYDYGELYAGINWSSGNARVYLSPRYFGGLKRTIYGEFELSHLIAGNVRASVHAGALWSLHDDTHEQSPARGVPDVRLSLGTEFMGVRGELWWSARFGDAGSYAGVPGQSRSAIGVTLSRSF